MTKDNSTHQGGEHRNPCVKKSQTHIILMKKGTFSALYRGKQEWQLIKQVKILPITIL